MGAQVCCQGIETRDRQTSWLMNLVAAVFVFIFYPAVVELETKIKRSSLRFHNHREGPY